MASDIYQYEVVIGTRVLHASADDIKEEFSEYDFYEMDPQGNLGDQLTAEDAQYVMKKIKEGAAKLTYLGGWCSDGTTWDSDDVRSNYNDQLKRFHDSLVE